MTEVTAIQHQQVETSAIEPFNVPGFGPAKTSLIAPLVAIADTMFDSIKEQEQGNAGLAIGIDNEVQSLSDDKKTQVADLEKTLILLYDNMPKRSDYKSDKKGQTAYHNALAAQQASIQKVQAQIQQVKTADDAGTSQAQSLAGDVSNEMATILNNSNTDYEMGKSILNDPVNTVANMIASLGAPKQ